MSNGFERWKPDLYPHRKFVSLFSRLCLFLVQGHAHWVPSEDQTHYLVINWFVGYVLWHINPC